MKKVTITVDGNKYTLMFNRKTAAMYNQMGFKIDDLTEKPLMAIPPFVLCAFKADHPTITQKKADAIWAAIPNKSKRDVFSVLIDMYTDTYTYLMGSDDDNDEDDEGNSATVEFEE